MKLKKLLITKLLPVISFLLFVNFSFGQKTITGTVTGTDGESIPGVTVLAKGTSDGTMTDALGKYSIDVSDEVSTLIFTYIGMEIQEIEISGTVVNCILQISESEIAEVVVIGYGEVKKEDATGSVVAVDASDFNQGAITSAQDLLVGKVAGMVVSASDGAPGSGSRIRIRGGSSLSASNDPLIIIDGIPIDNNNISGSANLLSMLNPDDIESVSVLKDASATAIYGNRASNGVILVTTKKGSLGKPMKINYNGSVSVSMPIEFMEVYTGDQMRKMAYDSDLFGSDTYSQLGSSNTNWQDEIYRTAVSHDHNVSLTGSYKILPYRVSLGYTNDNGILKNTDMQRMTGAINLNPTFFDNTLKVNINAKGMNTNHNFGDAGAIGSAINMDPSQDVFDVDSISNGYYQWENYDANLGTPNPVEQLLDADNKSVVNRFIGNIQLDYSLPWVEGLSANVNLAYDYTDSEGYNNRPVTSPSTLTSPLWGRLNDYTAKNTNKLLEAYGKYEKDLDGISSKIDVVGGYSYQYVTRESDSYTRGIVDEDHPYEMSDSSENFTHYNLQSFFGRMNYSLMNKYYVTMSVRADGSSRFAEGNKFGIFPAAAFAWKINEESFLKGVSQINEMKLRLGWGITGQQDIGSEFPYQSVYAESQQGFYYFIDGEYIPTLRPNAYDPNIRWEKTTTYNVGLDFGILGNKISGSVDYYFRETEDLLNTITIPTGSNFSNTLTTNIGSLENQGLEVNLVVRPISTKDMSLEIAGNFTYNKNEITKLLQSDDPDFIGILYGDAFTGQKQVTRVGYPAYSFFVNEQVYDSNGNPIEGLYTDLSGEGGAVNGDNADKYIFHNPEADFLIGFSIRFTYKNFDVSTAGRGSIGNYVYNQVAAGSSFDQMNQLGYWKNFPTYLDETLFVKRQFTSDHFVENASFLKLDYVSVGYSFQNLFKKLNGRISVTAQNALILTKYSGLDPEVVGGIDNNFYPRPRTFMLGLNITY